jgi:hypothetical protein
VFIQSKNPLTLFVMTAELNTDRLVARHQTRGA